MAQGSFHGRFVWQELMTEDTASAATFYSKVVGWHTQPSAVDPSYTQFGVGSNYYAGMMKLPDEARASGAKPQWLPYIGAADLEATVAAAERLGGTVKRAAHDIPTIGRFAILADPQGAAFAVFKPAMDGGATPPATPPRGSFAWMELATSNYEAAFDFYSKLFGWQAMHRMDMGPQGVYLIFGADGAQRGGIYKLNQERSSRPYWLAYAEVASADAAAAAATAAGGKVIVGPLEVPGGGRIVQVIDPSGAMFAVHAMPAAKPAAPPAAKPAAAATTPPAAKPPAPKPVAAAPAAPKPPAPTPPAAKPAAPAAAKPAPVPAKPAVAPAKPAPAAAAPSAKPAAKKAAPKKKAAKKPAAKKAAAKKKKPAAKKKVARKKAAGKKGAARKGAAKSARKSAKKAARKPAKKAGRGKRKPAKARRKK